MSRGAPGPTRAFVTSRNLEDVGDLSCLKNTWLFPSTITRRPLSHICNPRRPQDATVHPSDGVLVYDLHIEGAAWDHASKCLCDPRPDQMRALAPIMHFLPETNHEHNPGEC